MAVLADLAPWRMSIRNLVVGGAGNPYRFATVPEGFGLPEVSASVTDYAQADGGFVQGDRHESRVISGEVLVYPANRGGASLWRAVELLKAAFVRSSVDLPVEFRVGDGRAVRVYARPSRCEVVEMDPNYGVATVAFRLVCGDPLLRSEERSATFTPASGSGTTGRTYPRTYPRTYGTVNVGISTGLQTLTNDGNYRVPWRAEFRGPVSAPRIEHLGTGRAIRWVGSVPSDQTLVVDSGTRVVTLDGYPAFDQLDDVPDWFWLEPGDNELSFTAASGTGALTITYSPAWM
jgi:hypothetical protein